MKSDLEMWFKLSKKKQIIFSICNIIFPLIIGAVIYFLFVPTAHISEILYKFIGKSIYISSKDLTGTFVTCFLADFLWAYALFFLVFVILAQKKSDIWIVLLICLIFETVIEFLQLTPIIDGTFDWFDILFECFADLLGVAILVIYCYFVNKHG